MELETGILQEICDQAEIDAVVTVFGSRGRVVVSSKRERIGSFHERAAKIMAGEIDSVSVTAEEAALSSTMLEGCTSSIDFDGERLFCVGVAAPLDVARRYIRIVRLWVLSPRFRTLIRLQVATVDCEVPRSLSSAVRVRR
jgi:sugar diacid utilization regulator